MKIMRVETSCALVLAMLLFLSACATSTIQSLPSVTPLANTESWASWWMVRHDEKLAAIKKLKASKQDIEVLFVGDSITQGWEKEGLEVWNRYYKKYNALELGFSGDRTEHILWRLQHGEVDGLHPKVTVLMCGTNNTGHRQEDPKTTAAAIKRIIDELQQRMPDTKILLLAIFPRDEKPDSQLRRINEGVNAILPAFADNKKIFFLNINKALLNPDGTLSKDVMPDLLHPNKKGYEVWAREMEPELQKLMQ
jgi:beta-glucosidase